MWAASLPRPCYNRAKNFHAASYDFAEHGIEVDVKNFDAAKMIARKDEIVTKLTGGIGFLFKKNKVDSLHGKVQPERPKRQDVWQIEVDNNGDKQTVEAKQVIIADAGSVPPRPLPLISIDNINVLDNEGALNLEAVPQKLGVIGSGVIGLEMVWCGSVWVPTLPFWKRRPPLWPKWPTNKSPGSVENFHQRARAENRAGGGNQHGEPRQKRRYQELQAQRCQSTAPLSTN